MMDTRSLRCPHSQPELGQAGMAETAGDKAVGRVAPLMAQTMRSIWAKGLPYLPVVSQADPVLTRRCDVLADLGDLPWAFNRDCVNQNM
jgi:hypothetical protein